MNENIYGRFAHYYANELYAQFSDGMLEQYDRLSETYSLPIKGKLLDVACGNGVFGIGMAQRNWDVTGVDQSADQISIAKEHSENLVIDWQVGDMREMAFENEFNLVTCWFDSLNYMLTPEDLKSALCGMYNALKPGGSCVFDMNTIHGLMVNWQKDKDYLHISTPELIEIHHNECEWERHLAHLHITIFDRGERRSDGSYEWNRMDEIHTERGYPVKEIQAWLAEIGFTVVDTLGSLRGYALPKPESPRVWFVCRK